MIVEDFYTGEPVFTGSPPNFSSDLVLTMDNDEIEATNMAAFGKAAYEESNSSYGLPIVSSDTVIYPGGYGYNSGNTQARSVAVGYSPSGNPLPIYNQYHPNPVFQQPEYAGYCYGPGYNNQYYQPPPPPPPQPQRVMYHINGIGHNGEFLPPIDYKERIAKIEKEYWAEIEELEMQTCMQMQSSVYGNNQYGYNPYCNYYGPNQWQYNAINNKLYQKIKELEDEARENRILFDMRLSKLAHNIAKDPISDEEIEERYRGKDVEVPSAIVTWIEQSREEDRFNNLVPFDNSHVYREFHARVSAEFHEIVKEDGNLEETFANMGIIAAKWEMEEEMHRRRNANVLYNPNEDNAYKYFVRSKAKERLAREKGLGHVLQSGPNYNPGYIDLTNRNNIQTNPGYMDLTNNGGDKMPATTVKNNIDICNIDSYVYKMQQDLNKMREDFANSLPGLEGATISEDGTLNLPPIPDMYSINNSQEIEYDAKKERFGRFVDSIKTNKKKIDGRYQDTIYLENLKQQKKENYDYG